MVKRIIKMSWLKQPRSIHSTPNSRPKSRHLYKRGALLAGASLKEGTVLSKVSKGRVEGFAGEHIWSVGRWWEPVICLFRG